LGLWGRGPHPQTPIPNPQSPIPILTKLKKIYLLITIKIKLKIIFQN